MTATRKKTATRRKPQRNTLYLPSASREELDKIALEIGYRRGRTYFKLWCCPVPHKKIFQPGY